MKPACSTEGVPGEARIHRVNHSPKTKNKKQTKNKKREKKQQPHTHRQTDRQRERKKESQKPRKKGRKKEKKLMKIILDTFLASCEYFLEIWGFFVCLFKGLYGFRRVF